MLQAAEDAEQAKLEAMNEEDRKAYIKMQERKRQEAEAEKARLQRQKEVMAQMEQMRKMQDEFDKLKQVRFA